jgi:hypothetical protein
MPPSPHRTHPYSIWHSVELVRERASQL